MNDNVQMLLEGTLADMITKLDQSIYRIIYGKTKGQSICMSNIKKALPWTSQAALLFRKLLLETLQEWGYILNLYDQCVANENI